MGHTGLDQDQAARLPRWVAHADWGSSPAKRVVATARLGGAGYRVRAPRTVEATGGLLERMHVADRGREPTLLGFDFPIGLPRAYAHLVGVQAFTDWFAGLDAGSVFFQVADDISQVSLQRPFFPQSISTRSPGIKHEFRRRLGLRSETVLRRCDRAHESRRAASELFWTLGPQAVGKAAVSGWRDTLRPALAEPDRRYAIWPFDGELFDLLGRMDAVIVETYPANAYRQLGLRMGTPGTAKTNQHHRRAEAPRLHRWCAQHGVKVEAELGRMIEDGFGPARGGEDLFDAVVGLLSMINTLVSGREPPLPDDAAVHQIEGWMFGQPAV